MGKDYTANTGTMEEAISSLKANNRAMADLNDQIRGIVLDKFAAQGITGDTANMMADKYVEKVASSAEKFIAQDEDYIKKSENVHGLFQDNAEKTASIVERI